MNIYILIAISIVIDNTSETDFQSTSSKIGKHLIFLHSVWRGNGVTISELDASWRTLGCWMPLGHVPTVATHVCRCRCRCRGRSRSRCRYRFRSRSLYRCGFHGSLLYSPCGFYLCLPCSFCGFHWYLLGPSGDFHGSVLCWLCSFTQSLVRSFPQWPLSLQVCRGRCRGRSPCRCGLLVLVVDVETWVFRSPRSVLKKKKKHRFPGVFWKPT